MKNNICDYHDKIAELTREIEELNIASPHYQRSLISRLTQIQELIVHAKISGQKMEKRLRQYYDAVASLGFLRTK